MHACADGVVTRRHLAETLGVSISAVNSWAAGSRAPSLEDIARFEEVCHRPRGWILARAGYAPGGVDTDLENALRTDPSLSPEWREILADAYAQARDSSAPSAPRVRRRRRVIDVDPNAVVHDVDLEDVDDDFDDEETSHTDGSAKE